MERHQPPELGHVGSSPTEGTSLLKFVNHALVAQLDRALAFEAKSRPFESDRGC